ncbi:hypothetical protein MTCOM_10890 [Moorella thermoacetica]|uniref:hypothetical protein n=1 Tax=Neomoorella thermoacetica TaxID=1525 RepID=UPI0030D2EAD7
MVTVNVQQLYGEQAELDQLPEYKAKAKEQAGHGNDVVLTGLSPVWLYLAFAHTPCRARQEAAL